MQNKRAARFEAHPTVRAFLGAASRPAPEALDRALLGKFAACFPR